MYYILLAIALIIVYSFVTKIISSIVKSCLIVVGIALLIGTVYVFLVSRNRPMNIFGRYIVEDFSVRKAE